MTFVIKTLHLNRLYCSCDLQKLQVIYDGCPFICKVTPRIDIEFVDRKLTVFNELLENEINHSFNNVDL